MSRPGASPDGLPPLRDVIKTHDLTAKKSFGQNFLLDFNVTRRIARQGGALEGVTVFEVGPGPGGLTRALLLEGAHHVVAIERDQRCRPILNEIAEAYPGRLTLIEKDALHFNWAEAAQKFQGPKRIIANLPYGVATALLVAWLEQEPWPAWFDSMVLMFQKEVAERIVAKPNEKPYGRLGVLAQWRTSPAIVMTLPPEAFTPAPKVASAVVYMRPRKPSIATIDVETLGRVTAAAFGQRRKMLRASLKSLVKNPADLLDVAGIKQTDRAENLSVQDFARLTDVFQRSPAGK